MPHEDPAQLGLCLLDVALRYSSLWVHIEEPDEQDMAPQSGVVAGLVTVEAISRDAPRVRRVVIRETVTEAFAELAEKQFGKRCPRCQEIKPLGEFPKDSRRPDGVWPWCKACNRENVRARTAAKRLSTATSAVVPAARIYLGRQRQVGLETVSN